MKKDFIYSLDEFKNVVYSIADAKSVNISFIYEVYLSANEIITELRKRKEFSNLNEINQNEIISYLLGEYIYSTIYRSEKEKEEFLLNGKIKDSMANIVADKYLSLSKFMLVETRNTNSFMPPISSLNVYLNLLLNVLNGFRKKDPASSLISDLLYKAVSLCKNIISLLVSGAETEAFSCWRTLHECECTILVLAKHGARVIQRYLIHMNYGLAFKDMYEDKQKQDEIFVQIKEEMKIHNLKSKDVKKYIEYGWLYSIKEALEDSTFKLNFRDGLEKIAGLKAYSQRYESSSEIVHSTPLLIYSNKEYFYYITLLSTYESFFRIEQVFMSLLDNKVGSDILNQYKQMRSIYYPQLVNIHLRESNNFNKWKVKNK